MENKRAKERGQLLVEASVATGIIVILVISVVTLSLRALNQNRLVSDQVIATNLAAEGYEIAKNILDGNAYKGIAWNKGFLPGKYEVDYTSLPLFPPDFKKIDNENDIRFLKLNVDDQLETYGYNYDSGEYTPFKRTILISTVGSPTTNQINITSTVIWNTPKKPAGETVSVSGALLGWR